eukprot:9483042-Pyramimonas_sp.AAC.1
MALYIGIPSGTWSTSCRINSAASTNLCGFIHEASGPPFGSPVFSLPARCVSIWAVRARSADAIVRLPGASSHPRLVMNRWKLGVRHRARSLSLSMLIGS